MNRPHVHVNVAASADGKIDTILRQGSRISSIADKARVDRLRAGVDAVLVGGRTLLAEDPNLTINSLALRAERKAQGLPENPAKVGVVTLIGAENLPGDGDFLACGPAKVYVFTTTGTPPEVIRRLEASGAVVNALGKDRVDLPAMLESLHQAGIRTVLVEGGGTLIAEFFRMGLVDELTIYVAPIIFGGESAPTLADGGGFMNEEAPRLRLLSVEKFDHEGGVLLHYEVTGGR